MEIYEEVSREKAFEAFPNFCIYWREPNEQVNTSLHFRAWWHEINGKFHVFPEGKDFRYFMKKKPD